LIKTFRLTEKRTVDARSRDHPVPAAWPLYPMLPKGVRTPPGDEAILPMWPVAATTKPSLVDKSTVPLFLCSSPLLAAALNSWVAPERTALAAAAASEPIDSASPSAADFHG